MEEIAYTVNSQKTLENDADVRRYRDHLKRLLPIASVIETASDVGEIYAEFKRVDVEAFTYTQGQAMNSMGRVRVLKRVNSEIRSFQNAIRLMGYGQ